MIYSPLGKMFQLGYVTNDIEAAVVDCRVRLGVQNFSIFPVGAAAGKDAPYGARIAAAWCGAMMIELIQPIGNPAPVYVDDIALPGELVVRFNHIGIILPEDSSWADFLANVAAHGTNIAWRGSDPERINVAYVDTRSTLGHYCEYVQMSPPIAALFESTPRN